MTEHHQTIELPLVNLLVDEQGGEWKPFIAPTLTLSDDRNVGIILGASGSGKSILANHFITAALEQSYNVLYRDCFDTQYLANSNNISPTDIAFNELSEIARNNTEQFLFLPECDSIPSAAPKTLLVIDELHYQLKNSPLLQSQLRNYINEGGFILLIDQDTHTIDNMLASGELQWWLAGFTLTSEKGDINVRELNTKDEPKLSHLFGFTYSWKCNSAGYGYVGGRALIKNQPYEKVMLENEFEHETPQVTTSGTSSTYPKKHATKRRFGDSAHRSITA